MIAVQGWLEADKLETGLIMQYTTSWCSSLPDPELDVVKNKLPELMCGVAKLAVPLVVDVGVGPNWDKAH